MRAPTPYRRPSPRSDPQRAFTARKDGRAGASARQADAGSWRDAARGLGGVLLAAPLALFTVVLLTDGPDRAQAAPELSQAGPQPQLVNARFGPCIGGERHTCVVDGDTIWLEGTKIRIADIDAPEVFSPDCAAERATGQRATARLTQWLNAGAFEVMAKPDGRDEDRYGRKLRVLARGGESAVEPLVAEGVAGRWGGAGREWC